MKLKISTRPALLSYLVVQSHLLIEFLKIFLFLSFFVPLSSCSTPGSERTTARPSLCFKVERLKEPNEVGGFNPPTSKGTIVPLFCSSRRDLSSFLCSFETTSLKVCLKSVISSISHMSLPKKRGSAGVPATRMVLVWPSSKETVTAL
ncbi:hypothetical protein DH26_gp148 [Chloriridovirus anopheles1]|uniref:Uncharacterized protein n=1 Tax=Chloriridovirus anopheles1 TaxID=1465751 RepID=W8QE98_9VIRU|nr:hypothetical protein DH26_gp148 [Anopheles minimus iridovirus]AHL67635.1 hypothetical protein AMIV_148 [Anopheles minimus iridovirus]